MVSNTFDVLGLVRANIQKLVPYRCARDDFSSGILLDANENAFGPCLSDEKDADLILNRYPDPYIVNVKKAVMALRGLSENVGIFAGVGSDEAIDLLMRVFCVPGKDAILICPPTYGMYTVSANINDVHVTSVPLTPDFQLQPEKILRSIKEAQTEQTPVKLVFACSPGNPTGTLLKRSDMVSLLESPDFQSILVVDEAYIDFCQTKDASMLPLVEHFPNLIVLQTCSKSFGLAGLRLGFAFAKPDIISFLNRTKPPYNISSPTSRLAERAFSPDSLLKWKQNIKNTLVQRDRLVASFNNLPGIHSILGQQDANFILVRLALPPSEQFESEPSPLNAFAMHVYLELAQSESDSVVVRFRGTELHCEGCLRITVGTDAENQILEKKWRDIVGPFFASMK